jgi:hypothetical protein
MTLAVSAVCNAQVENNEVNKKDNAALNTLSSNFQKVLRYQFGWENLTLKNKTGLLPYSSRNLGVISCGIKIIDIIKNKKSLNIYQNYKGDKSTEDQEF